MAVNWDEFEPVEPAKAAPATTAVNWDDFEPVPSDGYIELGADAAPARAPSRGEQARQRSLQRRAMRELTANDIWGAPPQDMSPRVANPMVKPGTTPPPTIEERPLASQMTREMDPGYSPPESELMLKATQEDAQARANAPIVPRYDPIAEGTAGSISKRTATAGDVATGLINEPRIAGGKVGSAMMRMGGDVFGVKLLSEAGANLGRKYKDEEDNLTPQFDSRLAADVYSGLKSTVDTLTVLALTGFAGRGMAAADAFGGKAALEAIPSVGGKTMMAANLAPLAGLTTADSYHKYRERGATPLTAAVGALGDGAVEALTEMAPMSYLVNKLGKAGFGEFITGLIAREMPGEQAATFLQDAMDTAIANPNKTWGDFLKERPSAALSTAIAVFTQTAVMGGLSAIANRATRAGQPETAATPSAQSLWDQKIGAIRPGTDTSTSQPPPPPAGTGGAIPGGAIPASEVLGRPEPPTPGDQAAPGTETPPAPGSTPTGAVAPPEGAPDVGALMPEIERVRAAGIEMGDWLAQGDVLGREWSPETTEIITRLSELDPGSLEVFYKAMESAHEAQDESAASPVQPATEGNAATIQARAATGAEPGATRADQEGTGAGPSATTTEERIDREAQQDGKRAATRGGEEGDVPGVGTEGGVDRERRGQGASASVDGSQEGQGPSQDGAGDDRGLGRRTDEKGRELHTFEVNGKPVETHVNPTEGQKLAGNYKKEPVWVDGLKMKFEHGPGDERSGTDRNGNKWSIKLTHPYGYIVETSDGAAPRGKDKDHIDVFYDGTGDKVFVIDQKNLGTGLLDEHKVIWNSPSLAAAKKVYLGNYSKGWKGLKHITEVSKAEFREWLRSGDKNKLFSNWHKKVLPQTPVVFQRAGISKPEDERAVRVMGTGKVVGAPPGKDTIKDRNELVRRLVGLMEHPNAVFEKSHLWYERSGMAIRLLTRGDRALAEKVTRLMAVYSQGNSAGSNVTATIKSMIQIARGDEKVLAGRFPNETAKRIPAILAAPKMSLDVRGVDNKVLNFYRNLIDPATGEDAHPHASTQDRWMMRLMGYPHSDDSETGGGEALSPTQYAYAADVIRRVARLYEERHGVKLKPRQVQGVLWTYVKNTADAVKAKAKGQPFTPKAIDFYDYAVRATAAVTFETIPGTGSTIPGIMNATREQREEYTRAAREVTLDEDGNDLIMEAVGVSPLYVTRFGTGSYQGNINPNVITGVVVPGGVKPDMKVANAYAAAVGYVYGQDSVLWHLPNPDGKTVGVALRPLGKSFSKAYERALYNHIRGLVPGVEFSRVGSEFRFLNLKGDDGKPWSGIKDADFIERIYQAASTFKSDIPIGHADFRADAKLIEGGKNGEGYKARIAASGRPDLQERLDGLKSEVQTVNDDFAKRYGWDKPVAAFNRGSLFGGRLHGAGSAADTSTGGSSGPAPAQAGLRDGGESARAQDQQRLAVGKNTPVFHQRPVQPDAVSIVGIHYGNTGGLPLLSGLSFGSGAKSEEASRVKAGGIRKRVYFYAQNREGIPPAEGEVYGNHVYRTKLTNILSVMSPAGRSIVNASARLPNAGGVDMNDFERRVVEAGYDGYAVLEGGLRDTAIVLGVDNVPVEYLGTRPDQKNVARFNRGAARLADLDVPGGEPRKYEDEFTRFERAAWVLANFARDEHLFRYPTSKGKSVAEIAKDFNPTIEVTKGPGWAKDMVAAYSIKLPKNKDGLPMGTFEVMVYKNDTIEMNVAGLTSGRGGGSLAYQLVAQYAHNTGKQFLGDRAGLEPIAHARRAEAMVSSYLRTGSTKHFDPHIYMIDDGFMGDAVSDEEMIDTLQVLKKYRNLDDLTKLALTIRYSFGKILAAAPADFGDLRYDFEKNRFYHLWDSTKALGPAYFDALAEKPGLRPIGGGSTSLRRAAIVNTVLHASDREAWARILAGVRKAADGGNPRALIGLAYDRGAEAGKRFPASDARRTVESVTSKWQNPPKLVLHDTLTSADDALRAAGYDTSLPENRVDDLTKGFYVGDTIHMVLPNFDSQRDVMQTLAHEAVGHYGMRALLGKERWQQVVREIKTLKAGGNPAINRLWQDVIETHGNLPADSMADEVIARAAEEAVDRDGNVRPGFAWFKRLLSHVAEWLRANGFDVKFTNAELAGLLSRAQQNVQRGNLAADEQGHRFNRGGASRDDGPVRPYETAPDALMGFRANGPQKGFHETNYPHEQGVRVTFDNGDVIEDGIKGMNKAHALERARRNWPGAKIEALDYMPPFNRGAITDTTAFKAWFGDSKVVDENGDPLRVFTGTSKDFDFKSFKAPKNGVWFTSDPASASQYAVENDSKGLKFDGRSYTEVNTASRVIPAYLRMQNPKVYDTWPDSVRLATNYKAAQGALWTQLRLQGYDGVIGPAGIYVVFEPTQIKSAVGNNGDFDPKNASIIANRGRANGTLPKTGLLDAALRFPGKYVARFITQPLWARVSALADRLVPEKVKHGLVSDYGLPEPYLDAKMDRAARTNQLLRSTHNLINDIAALDRQQARVAYLWMTASPDLDAENEIMETLPPEARATLVEMKQMVDDIGREAVALGLLEQETYERNKLAYLHRSYKKHEADMTEQQKAARRRAIAIRGDQFKQRGLRDDISAGDLQYESTPLRKGGIYKRIEQRDEAPEGQRGKLRRVIYWPAGKPVPPMYAGWRVDGLWEARWIDGDKVGMWRDFTREEREMMGEIDEVRYAFGQTMIKSVRDVETARFLKWAADNHSVATADEVAARGGTVVDAVDKRGSVQTFGKDEWVEVPGTKVPGTNVKRYGALAGRYIPGIMFNDLRQTVNFQNNVWDKMLRAWKISKTALSPAVHVNNVMSNFIMADFADVRGRDIARSLITIVKANRGNEDAKRMIERFTDSGGDLGNFAHLELGQEIEKILMKELNDELLEQSDEVGQLVRVSQVLDLAMHGRVREALAQAQLTKPFRFTMWPFRYMIEVYGKEDTVFRLAKFMKEVEVEGKTDRDAGKAARDAFLNYEINAPWINAARRSVLPFVAFGYRAIPLLMKTAVDKPWKFAKYAAVAGGLNALVYAILGGDDKDKERRLLPDELSGSTWGIFPSLVRMPWNDPHGSPIFLDVRRWIPAGDVFETNPNSAIPIPSWAMPGGPLAMVGELIANRSMFTGKDIVNETDTKTEKFSKVLDYLWKSFAPNLIGVPGTYATSNVNRALRGETDSLGREKQVPYEVSNAFGVKLRPYPEDQLLANERAKMAHDLIDIGKTVQDLRRQYKRHGLSDEEFKEKLGEQQAKKTARINKYREKAGLGTIQ